MDACLKTKQNYCPPSLVPPHKQTTTTKTPPTTNHDTNYENTDKNRDDNHNNNHDNCRDRTAMAQITTTNTRIAIQNKTTHEHIYKHNIIYIYISIYSA